VEIRETLASKLEGKKEESDSTKTWKDLPKETSTKTTQKQANYIISKVKQSLLKTKKAIIGESPIASHKRKTILKSSNE